MARIARFEKRLDRLGSLCLFRLRIYRFLVRLGLWRWMDLGGQSWDRNRPRDVGLGASLGRSYIWLWKRQSRRLKRVQRRLGMFGWETSRRRRNRRCTATFPKW